MSSCERCWSEAQLRGVEYSDVVLEAEERGYDCTAQNLRGAKLRAGQFWDDAQQCDRREPLIEQAKPDGAA